MDKLEAMLNDSMIQSEAIREFNRYKKEKEAKRRAKVESILMLTEKIADQLRDRKVEEITKKFNS